jgi:hypothetical protein
MALQGLQLALQKLEEGTAVNAIRSGGNESDRKTATEVSKTAQGAEVRTVDFVAKLEPGGLRPFLYMQHEMNLKHMEKYSFYCSEKELPDFISVEKDELPKVVHFEIVGSRGLLGEEQRTQRMTAVTAFASGNPLFAPLLNAKDILIDMYEDAGVKGAEKYIKAPQQGQIPPEVQAKLQEAGQMVQQLQAELQKEKSGQAAKAADVEQKGKLKAAELQQKQRQFMAEFQAEQQMAMKEQDAAARKQMTDAAFQRWQANLQAATDIEVARINAKSIRVD